MYIYMYVCMYVGLRTNIRGKLFIKFQIFYKSILIVYNFFCLQKVFLANEASVHS
jgi:hypothetical protein